METWLRPGTAIGAFILFALLETALPDRRRGLTRRARWPGAGVLVLASAVAARLALPVGLASVAVWAKVHQTGVLHHVVWPGWLDVVVALLALDLAVWAQHAATHKIPILWRLHRVHHTDPDVDVSTAFRFHPLEIVVSLVWKLTVIVALGAPPEAVFLFEIILNASAQFNHANMKLPSRLDHWLRLVIVTPAMHRVHHSMERTESDTNYGFCLSIWDRLFGTYKAQFSAGPDAPIGQPYWRTHNSAVDLLVQPFKVEPAPDDQGRPG